MCALFFGIHPIHQLAVFVMIKNNIFWRWDKAMFNSTITADLVLIGAGMKKPYIQRFSIVYFGKKDFIDMFF